MLRRKRKRFTRLVINAVAVIAGLYGGWRAAGALNNQRVDIPRPIPTTSPSSRPA